MPRFIGLLVVAVLASAGISDPQTAWSQQAERPRTEDLLPETTVAFMQIANVRDWIEKSYAGTFGRMMEDEAIASVTDRAWQEIESAYAEVQDRVGMSLEQIRSLPTGEIHIAVIAPRRQNLEFLVALEVDPESDAAESAAATATRLIDQRKSDGTEIETETTEDDIEISTFMVDEGSDQREVSYFFRDGLLVASTSKTELLAVLDRWAGREVDKVRPLSRNRKFVTIMNRCQGIDGLEPDMRLFVDPISLAKSATRGNLAAQGAINFLPVLGLDGLLAFGGSAIVANGQFQQVMHGHLLLANPRSGILEMFGLRPDQYEPDPWVPANVANYAVTSWDVQQTLTEVGKLVDTVRGTEGIFESDLEKASEAVGFSLQENLIDVLDGRFTYFQWSDPDAEPTINAACNGLGVGVNDVEVAENAITTLLQTLSDESQKSERRRKVLVEEKEHRGVRYWLVGREERPETQQRINERMKGVGFRRPQPSITLVDDTFILCESEAMIVRVIDTSQGEADSLAADPRFQDHMRSLIAAAGTDLPCVNMYSRPHTAIRDFLRFANDERTRAGLAQVAEKNEFFRRLQNVLTDGSLPDLETLGQYLASSAAIVTTDDTGYHMVAVTFAPDDE